MAEGQVLATAIVKFVADDSEYQAAKERTIPASNDIAKSFEGVGDAGQHAADAIKDMAGDTTTAAESSTKAKPPTDSLRTSTDDFVKSVHQAADALTQQKKGTDDTGPALENLSTKQETVKGTSLALGAALSVAGLALGAAAVVAGTYIEKAEAMRSVQLDVNKAIETMDASNLEVQFQKAIDEVKNYKDAYDKLTGDNESLGFWGSLGAAVTVVKNYFSDAGEKAVELAKGISIVYNEFDRGKESLASNNVELSAQAANMKLLALTAPDIATLTKALDEQTTSIATQAQNAATLKQLNDEKFYAEKKYYIDDLPTFEEANKAFDDLDAQMAQRAIERTAERSKASTEETLSRIENQKKIADIVAKQIEDEGKLLDLTLASMQSAAQAALAEADAREAQATATKNYYGQSLAGLAEYQAKRTEMVQTELQIEIDRINATAAADIEAQTKRRDALPLYSEAWQAEDRKIEITTEERDNKVQDLNQKMELAAIEGQGKITAATRAESDRQLEIAKAQFDLLKAQGQASLLDEVNFMAGRVRTWEEGGTKRLAAETALADQVKALHDSMASSGERLYKMAEDSLKAQGVLYYNEQDVLLEIQKIQADTLQLDNQRLGGTRLTYEEMDKIRTVGAVIAENTKTGMTATQNVATASMQWSENLRGIPQTSGQIASDLNKVGVAVSGIGQSLTGPGGPIDGFLQMTDAALGFVGSTGPLATLADNDFGNILAEKFIIADEALGKFIDGTVGGGEDFAKAIDKMMEEGRQWNENWNKEFGEDSTAHQFNTSFNKALTDTLDDIDDFYTIADHKIKEGNSKLADTVYMGLIGRLKDAIDAEALAS